MKLEIETKPVSDSEYGFRLTAEPVYSHRSIVRYKLSETGRFMKRTLSFGNFKALQAYMQKNHPSSDIATGSITQETIVRSLLDEKERFANE